MLSVAEEYLHELNPDADLKVFGQELNPESYAVCKSDLIIKGQNPENIVRGNSFDQDGHAGQRFDYMLSNPPFGVDWKNVQKAVEAERDMTVREQLVGLDKVAEVVTEGIDKLREYRQALITAAVTGKIDVGHT
ncbi:MAG: N-6 DNA methylase [Polyangiaceae bacterium]|nr:N-6 DNA methylase [Polyangiaceae bacterium]